MPRLHGYAVKGNRCFGTHNWGAKGRTNVIGALLFGAVLTVSLFQTNVNTGIFSSWVIEDLIPKLPANSVVIMDNASFHKGMLMKKAIEDAGHTLLYLPPYSPDPHKDILASACGFQWIVDSILNATCYKY